VIKLTFPDKSGVKPRKKTAVDGSIRRYSTRVHPRIHPLYTPGTPPSSTTLAVYTCWGAAASVCGSARKGCSRHE